MNISNWLLAGGLCALLVAPPALALEVDREVMPRITLGGRLIATLDHVDLETDKGADDEINLSDSSLLVRLDKRMYDDGVAGAVIGFKEHDEEVVFHQLHAFYWNRDFEVSLGRTRLPNTLLEFPVARDEDLLDYAYVGNASSNEEFDQLYGSTVSLNWFLDRKIQSLGVWAGTRINGEETPTFDNAPDGADSYGGGYVYEQSEDLRYVTWLRHAGLLADRQKVETLGEEEWMTAVIAGAEFNLVMNPQSNWSFAVQGIANEGIDGLTLANLLDLTDGVANRARAKYRSYVASLRYTARPNLLTRWQAALTVGYKDYSDFDDAEQTTIAPSLFYRLGQGVDLLAQYRHTSYGDALGDLTDNVAQVGIAFGLGATFNDNIGERASILNLEHGYIQ